MPYYSSKATIKVTEHTVLPLGMQLEDEDALIKGVTVEYRGPNSWAIKQTGKVLNKHGEWEYEMSPSNRDAEFLERCRFTEGKAIDLAIEKVQDASQ